VKKLLSALALAAAFVIGFGVVGCSNPTTSGTTTTTTTTDKGKETKVEGTYDKYDKDKDKITVKADGKDKEFDVKGIKPMVDGKEKTWDDLKKDDKVTVTEKDGKVTKVEKK